VHGHNTDPPPFVETLPAGSQPQIQLMGHDNTPCPGLVAVLLEASPPKYAMLSMQPELNPCPFREHEQASPVPLLSTHLVLGPLLYCCQPLLPLLLLPAPLLCLVQQLVLQTLYLHTGIQTVVVQMNWDQKLNGVRWWETLICSV
jgi:hypothetical protein